MKIKKKKNINLDDLAVMVAEGFNDVNDRMATKNDVADIRADIKSLSTRVDKLEFKVSSLESSVNNYLELSDKRYLELREVNRVMFKYLKLIVVKTKTPIDLTELEKFVK
jgi:uncharacterized protein YlxW (UPF0749 family)